MKLILGILMITFLLVGCGNDDPPPAPTYQNDIQWSDQSYPCWDSHTSQWFKCRRHRYRQYAVETEESADYIYKLEPGTGGPNGKSIFVTSDVEQTFEGITIAKAIKPEFKKD